MIFCCLFLSRIIPSENGCFDTFMWVITSSCGDDVDTGLLLLFYNLISHPALMITEISGAQMRSCFSKIKVFLSWIQGLKTVSTR